MIEVSPGRSEQVVVSSPLGVLVLCWNEGGWYITPPLPARADSQWLDDSTLVVKPKQAA